MGGRGSGFHVSGTSPIDFSSDTSDSVLYDGRADLTDEERDYIWKYTVMSGTPNSYLRMPDQLSSLKDSDIINKGIPTIDDAIARSDLKQDINVYRAVSAKRLTSDLKVGDVIEDKAYNSTSIRRDVVQDYANRYSSDRAIMKITVPSGKGRRIYIRDIAASSDQYEFLIKRGAKYRVTGISSDGTINAVMVI